MTIWNPAAVRRRQNLCLTEAEKAFIRSKLPLAPDGNYYVDAVFEGGGVKGTAFLGALRCFDEVGIRVRKVAGTSAGAITAALVAAEFSIDELERIVGELDYVNDLLCKKTSALILNGCPANDLNQPQRMIGNLLLAHVMGQNGMGQYSGQPFVHWLARTLGDRLPNFGALIPAGATEWYHERALKIIASDISRNEMLLLPNDLELFDLNPMDFSVAEAVRLSMSIPFFFEPGQLGDSVIVDGGILSNFPLWIYDAPKHRMPHCPTFGLQLTDGERSPRTINDPLDLLFGLLETMMVARDLYEQRTNDLGRVITIETTGITATQFNLTVEEKDFLYFQGYTSTRDFLINHWSWERHLEQRGYCPEKSLVGVAD